MMQRWGIRLGSSLAGIAIGLILASVVLDNLSMDFTALVQATLVFWVVHFLVQVVALRTLVRQPSIPMAGLLALAATVISLAIVNVIIGGLKISGVQTYIGAALIVWIAMAGADILAGRKIRDLRLDNASAS